MSRDQKKAESRRRILDAARDVFFRDGFMRANLDEMAEKAGVAKGTLYRYFESKADLYVAVLADNLELFLRRMEDAAKPRSSALERVRSIGRFYFSHWLEHPDYFQIFWAIDNESVIGELPREVIDKIASFWEANLNVLHSVLEEGVKTGEFVPCDTWEIANVLWSIANSLIESDSTKARRQIRRRPLEPLYSHAIDTVVRGILVDPKRVELAPASTPRVSTLIRSDSD
jgi:AcrR family transcriptional regulator